MCTLPSTETVLFLLSNLALFERSLSSCIWITTSPLNNDEPSFSEIVLSALMSIFSRWSRLNCGGAWYWITGLEGVMHCLGFSAATALHAIDAMMLKSIVCLL